MQGLRNTIGAALIPTVTELASEFTAFVVENRPLIAEFATTLGQTFRDAIPVIAEVVTGLGNVAGAVGSVLAFVADLLGGWDNLGIAVGAAFVAPSIIAIGRLGIAIAGLIAATGPVGLVIAGVAAAAALIIGNWDSIKAGAVAAWEAIKTGAGVAFDWIAEKVGWLAESGFLGPIGLIIAHWDEVKAAGLEAWSALQDGAQAAVDWVVEKFEWLSGRVTALLAPIREAFGFVGSTIERVGNWWSDRERGGLAPGNYTNPVDEFGNVQTRRRGGPMMPGATLVGEGGPEMIFPSRAAYVATARQTRALTEGGGGRTLNVGGITINAGALSDPRAIADEVLRVLTDRERAAMYDGGLA